MVSWSTVQSLVLFLGPWLVPKLWAWYRSVRNRPATQIKPLSQKTSQGLSILFISGLIALVSTLPLFAPENIFRLTQSRLHTSGGVLLTRLAAIRNVTPNDEKLREIFDAGGIPARLLYARYGPDVLLNSPLSPAGYLNAHTDFILYALPTLLVPHLLNLLALAFTTSPLISGPQAARWRPLSIVVGLGLAFAEIYYVYTYDDTFNLRSTRVNDIDFLYWKLPLFRGLAIATLDGLLGWCIYLQATNRAFIVTRSVGDRALDTSVNLEKVLLKARGVGVVRNAVVRDVDSRRKAEDYWRKEGEIMKDVFEEPEVLEAQRNALKRTDAVRVGREAEQIVDSILGAQTAVRAPPLQ